MLILAMFSILPSVSYLVGSTSYLLCFHATRYLWCICWRNDNVDKQPGKSFMLHLNTAPLFTRHDLWTPETLFHPNDPIISSISLNQGDTSNKTNPPPTSRSSSVVLVCQSLSFSLRHSLSLCLIPFLSPSQFRLLSHPTSSLCLSFRIVEK